jgi:uncharacterized protein YbjT (DUF2867 family)
MEGIDTAFYLVHSMGSDSDFEVLDRKAAEIFGASARDAGIRRIIYLGGLGETSSELSPHLRSRHEVGNILARSGIPVIELRASIVIGSGSLSFELIRSLVERLPVMITPRWVSITAQPIAISDLVEYLVHSVDVEAVGHQIFEIGGADVVSYGQLMKEYARQRNVRRLMITVPVLTPRLSSLWLGLVTPVYARIGRALIESLRHPTIIHDQSAEKAFGITPKRVQQAMAEALRNEDRDFAETRWSDALSSSGKGQTWGGTRFGNRLVDQRVVQVAAPPATAFAPIRKIGGANGWYYATWLWHLRGFLDLLVGGVGVRRGRRDPEVLHPGDTVDWWRVEAFEPDRRLFLYAEMKLPGRAWLEFTVVPAGAMTIIRQTAIFDPIGLLGLAYWYGIYPLHVLVFRGMINNIRRVALKEAQDAAH